jgi:formamidopyrimidine-DNA glycosylase
MPELPDITVYLEALEQRIKGHELERVQVTSPFLLRTATPPLASIEGKKVLELRRLGKRICLGFEADLWLVLHLMIAGRLHWKTGLPPADLRLTSKFKAQLALFRFDNGVVTLTEAGTQRRASMHLVTGEQGLRSLDPGGIELFTGRKRAGKRSFEGSAGEFVDLETFARVLKSENHTLKRALTDPHLFSGIGNAYSDEILWQAQLSPVKLTHKLNDEEIERLHAATRDSLIEWVERLRTEAGEGFPEKVTAFRKGMATHGRYKEPCPRCGTRIQRIRYAANETNYCPTCQTGGKLLADRALSRLLREDWPRSVDELG